MEQERVAAMDAPDNLSTSFFSPPGDRRYV